MKLLLTSGGNTNKSIENSFIKLLGKSPQKSKLAFIPTAANVEKENKTWLINDINNFKKIGFSCFDIVDTAAVPKDIWLPRLDRADVLIIGGGVVYYLLEQIKKSGLEKILPEFLKTKVYVGISAGSMVMAKNISLSSLDILYFEKTKKIKNSNGLGYIDFEIRPHLNSKWYPKLKFDYLSKLAKQTPHCFYALDDNSAIEVIDKKISIISEGKWKKFN